MDNYDKFIGKLYDILINSDIINYEGKPKDIKEKKERLEKYIDKLNRVQDKIISKNEHIDTLKKLYYDKYVIKKENIPDAYFKSLEKRYLDEGHGHHNLVNPNNEIDKRLKEEHINVIIREQIDSLDAWLNYFLSKDSDYLPMWGKVWAFQGMLDIGNLNKDKDGYGRRSNTAINPFVSLDSEILGKCVELVKDTFENKEVPDSEIDKLVGSGSFAKLYGKLLANKKQLKVYSDEGIWIEYNYETEEEVSKKIENGKEPEYLKLYNSLQGYNTGWCTAGSKETAKDQICGGGSYPGGDFYVFYTKDKNNNYKIPRIAIRMDQNSIGEIRGVANSQNIETNMESILEEKLKEFPDGKSYHKKVNDMKKLTEIYNNYQDRDLTKEELSFLYEIDDNITGFGYRKDPRIDEIKKRRNKRKDLSIALGCDESSIGLIKKDLFRKQLVYYQGDIYLSDYLKLKKLNLNLPQSISGYLDLRGLTTAKGLELPKKIGQSLYLRGLTAAKGLKLPQIIGKSLDLDSLTTAEGLELPQSIDGYLDLSSLTTTKGLKLPQSIREDLDLSGLTTAEELELPQSIGESLDLSSLTTAKGLKLPQSIGEDLDLSRLTTAEGLELPQNIGGSLYLTSLTTAEGLELPQSIGGSLYLSNQTTAEGLELPQSIGASLDLSGLTTAEGLKLPQSIGGYLDLSSLTTAEGLKLPQKIGGSLYLTSLTTAEGFELPQSIGGSLDLSDLTTAKGLELPQKIGKNLYLSSIISIKDIVLPQNVDSFIVYNYKYYKLEELRKIQQEEINASLIRHNSKGFATAGYTIIMSLIISLLGALIGLLLIRK